MLTLHWNEMRDKLAMANSVHWIDHMLRMEVEVMSLE